MNGGIVGGADAADGGVTDNLDIGRCHGQGDGDVKAIGDPVCKVGHRLAHLNIEGVFGGNDVLLEFDVRGGLVLEQRGNFLDIESIEAIEIEVLKADAGEEFILANGLGAFGEDRTKALTGTRVDTETGVEAV